MMELSKFWVASSFYHSKGTTPIGAVLSGEFFITIVFRDDRITFLRRTVSNVKTYIFVWCTQNQ